MDGNHYNALIDLLIPTMERVLVCRDCSQDSRIRCRSIKPRRNSIKYCKTLWSRKWNWPSRRATWFITRKRRGIWRGFWWKVVWELLEGSCVGNGVVVVLHTGPNGKNWKRHFRKGLVFEWDGGSRFWFGASNELIHEWEQLTCLVVRPLFTRDHVLTIYFFYASPLVLLSRSWQACSNHVKRQNKIGNCHLWHLVDVETPGDKEVDTMLIKNGLKW